MNKQQQIILTLIIATLLIEFGSLTKLKQIWYLAFLPKENAVNEQSKKGVAPLFNVSSSSNNSSSSNSSSSGGTGWIPFVPGNNGGLEVYGS